MANLPIHQVLQASEEQLPQVLGIRTDCCELKETYVRPDHKVPLKAPTAFRKYTTRKVIVRLFDEVYTCPIFKFVQLCASNMYETVKFVATYEMSTSPHFQHVFECISVQYEDIDLLTGLPVGVKEANGGKCGGGGGVVENVHQNLLSAIPRHVEGSGSSDENGYFSEGSVEF